MFLCFREDYLEKVKSLPSQLQCYMWTCLAHVLIQTLCSFQMRKWPGLILTMKFKCLGKLKILTYKGILWIIFPRAQNTT